MSIYIPISSVELAEHLSKSLFELSRTLAIRKSWEISDMFCV